MRELKIIVAGLSAVFGGLPWFVPFALIIFSLILLIIIFTKNKAIKELCLRLNYLILRDKLFDCLYRVCSVDVMIRSLNLVMNQARAMYKKRVHYDLDAFDIEDMLKIYYRNILLKDGSVISDIISKSCNADHANDKDISPQAILASTLRELFKVEEVAQIYLKIINEVITTKIEDPAFLSGFMVGQVLKKYHQQDRLILFIDTLDSLAKKEIAASKNEKLAKVLQNHLAFIKHELVGS